MKRLLPVVVVLAVCAILMSSFKPIPKPIDSFSSVSRFSYSKFMYALWLKPITKVKAPEKVG